MSFVKLSTWPLEVVLAHAVCVCTAFDAPWMIMKAFLVGVVV